eukprot:UN27811
MTHLTSAIEKPANLLAKKTWSSDPIICQQLVADLEEAWKRCNKRIQTILDDQNEKWKLKQRAYLLKNQFV